MTYRVRLAKLHALAPTKPPGWLEKGLALGTVDGDWLVFDQAAARALYGDTLIQPNPIPSPPAPADGPGTELKKLLRRFGIEATPNCKCNARAAEMNRRGADWCRENIETIVGWLREEAHLRRLPFSETAARWMARRAIKAASNGG